MKKNYKYLLVLGASIMMTTLQAAVIVPKMPNTAEIVPKVSNITGSDFESKVTRSQTPILVEYNATWCSHCKTMKPIVEQIASKFSDKMKTYVADIDSESELWGNTRGKVIPLFIVYKNGREVARTNGELSFIQLKSFINKNL